MDYKIKIIAISFPLYLALQKSPPLIHRGWCTLQCRIELSEKEESISASEIKTKLVFLLTIVTNESNLFQIELMLMREKFNLFKFFRQVFFKIIYQFTIGSWDDVDVLFKFAEIFDSS